MTDEVIIRTTGRIGEILLNRPKALNALNLEMIRVIHPALDGWAADDGIDAVLIRGLGGRAFCSGGDVRSIMTAPEGDAEALQRDFFAGEYALNYAISAFPKPFIALIDGITMGGGCGLSIHGSHRVASERTSLAMPETVLGLFPDVGASWFLNRLPGELGSYIGLAGKRLTAVDCHALGLATHYIPEASHEALLADLSDAPVLDAGRLNDLLATFAVAPPVSPMIADRPEIDRIFAGDDVVSILARLEAEAGKAEAAPWIEEALAVMRRASPTSLKLTLKLLRRHRGLPLAEALKIEFRLSQRCCAGHDFPEGVRAILIDKDHKPQWRPSSLGDVDDGWIDAFFDPLAIPDLVLE